MSLSIFDSKAIVPTKKLVESVIGTRISFWNTLYSVVDANGSG